MSVIEHRPGSWRETRSAELEAAWARECPGLPLPRVFDNVDGARALVGREPVGEDLAVDADPRWHVSLSRPDRLPTWDELVAAVHALRPGVVFCVPMPPSSWWLNLHPYTLHVWETHDANLVAQWRSEARGDTPT